MRRFQEKHGLDVDGIVGPKTLKVLNAEHARAGAKLGWLSPPYAPLSRTAPLD